MSISTRRMHSRFIVVSEDDAMRVASELDHSWSRYGVIDSVLCGNKLIVFFEEDEHLKNAEEFMKFHDISYRRCKV